MIETSTKSLFPKYNDEKFNGDVDYITTIAITSNWKRKATNKAASMSKQNIKREPLFFFIMRLNLKAGLFAITIVTIFIIFIIWNSYGGYFYDIGVSKNQHDGFFSGSNNNDNNNNNNNNPVADKVFPNNIGQSSKAQLHDIDCCINREYSVNCKVDEKDEVYVPFKFIKRYFDIYGNFDRVASCDADAIGLGDGDEHLSNVQQAEVKRMFLWQHANAKANPPKEKYDSRGVFTHFENYNVEVRGRVKCISAEHGVPVSTQWERNGYYYPTQIAQFGLSHYSKNLSEPAPKIKIIEDADTNQMNWTVPKSSKLSRIWHPKFNTSVIQYETAIDYDSAISLKIEQITEMVLSVDLLLVTNSSVFMVSLQHVHTKQVYNLNYMPTDLLISEQNDNIYYGLGSTAALNKWRHLTRDLYIDVLKGCNSGEREGRNQQQTACSNKLKRNEMRIVQMRFLGVGFFDNITLGSSAHMAHFYDAAEWFVKNQDPKTGGWSIQVKRKIPGFTDLKAGWLSAMGQGQAISVLTRAYWHSGGDKRYLRAAKAGLKPFYKLSKEGGVLAQFMDKYYWYEEYPTTPASFVLNGFIFSLLGLYDLNSTATGSIAREAGELYERGMHSLKNMLLLFDTGSGTSYDLRHLSLGIAPNLARWDYHKTHVNQLLLLATFDKDPILSSTAARWRGYMLGKRAKHN